jgi:hypothetical protein
MHQLWKVAIQLDDQIAVLLELYNLAASTRRDERLPQHDPVIAIDRDEIADLRPFGPCICGSLYGGHRQHPLLLVLASAAHRSWRCAVRYSGIEATLAQVGLFTTTRRGRIHRTAL